MDENKNNGELFGFDSTENNAEKNGYTVTPEGGFYSSAESDTVNENSEAPEVVEPAREEMPNFGFAPNGNYSDGASSQNKDPFVFKAQTVKPPKPVKEKKNYSFKALLASVIVAAIVGASCSVGGIAAFSWYNKNAQGNNTGGINQPPADVTSPNNVSINVDGVDATVVEAVAAKVTPSVVGIRTTYSVNNFLYGTQESSGEGSGVAYTEDGYIITNYHVIQEAVENRGESSEIRVFLSYGDNSEGYPATVVGYNISYDLAVIKINVTGLTPMSFADSADLNVGQFVVAIGNPGGLQFMGSVTYGVISGLNRILSDSGTGSAVELIQTDAAINPGNSGGALVNINGELVGINSSKLVSESYEGMGFAIPSNTTKEICDKIISKENDPDPYLGITISEIYDAETLAKHGYPAGAVVYSVVPGSPADDAGIQRADIITELNGVAITDYTVLGDALATCKPGDTVTIKIYRSKRLYSSEITIGSNNSQ